MARHFLNILDIPRKDAWNLLERAKILKQERMTLDILTGKTVVLLFEKSSTRTRVSFEVAIRELGGQSLLMTPGESQLGRSEPLRDTARVLSRYVHAVVVRTFGQDKLEEMARFASIPVLNALSDSYHPCQVLSDVMTMHERTPELDKLKVAWVGDGNNMAHSWINAAVHFPFSLHMAIPEGFDPDPKILENARNQGAKIELTRDPRRAVEGSDYVNTDVWASMGQEGEQQERMETFAPFQVNEELLARAGSNARVMHCLPAHRGEEITEGVIEGPSSIVWDQAENRLHMQKAILVWIFTDASTEREHEHPIE
ncbi:MAG: ornithine carbamoyltransferase [Desulfovibrionales bacterium]